MTRGADRLLRHFAANSLESAQNRTDRPIQRQRPMSGAVFVYRHPLTSSLETDSNWSQSLSKELENATGNRLRPVGSIVRRSSRPNRDVNRNPQRLPPTVASHRPPSPPVDPLVRSNGQTASNERQKSPVPTISIASEDEATRGDQKTNVPTTADELMKLLMEDDGTDRPVIFTIFEAANIDGVKHLSSKSRCTRYTWLVLIILFIGLCFYQIGAQAVMYWLTPVATNIIAVYPESLPFPVIAVCNNNQHRLSWLTGKGIQRRQPNGTAPIWLKSQLNESNVFDRVLLNGWDIDAGKFLRSAAHQRSRMIVRCELPNGSRCSSKDFRPLWTLTGLCWAINTDFERPMQVTGAGPGNALRLLVNVERYERVESCTPKLRSRSLPGLKVLIINQTDIPVSFLEGVNVPAGFTMDIPFWMRQRQKLPGRDCVTLSQTNGEESTKKSKMEERGELRDCLIGSYLGEIERRCNCTMRKAFNQQKRRETETLAGKAAEASDKRAHSPCNVLQYFDCVQTVLEWAKDKGFTNFGHCPDPCESIDYTAWQDMNELPTNVFPRFISLGNDGEENEETADFGEEDEEGTPEEELVEEEESKEVPKLQLQHCTHNQLVSGRHVERIKRAAREALEKQSRHQEDIQMRTRRMVEQLRKSVKRLSEMRWGWAQRHFMGVHKHLAERLRCYIEVPKTHANVFNAIANPKPQGEEERAEQLQQMLLGEGRNNDTKGAKSFEEVKRTFGRIAEERFREMLMMRELTAKIYSLFSADTFIKRLPIGLERMDKVLQMVKMYEHGQMTRESWAERMQTRNMRHFLEEDIYEDWHNLIVRDMEQNVLENIQKIEELASQIYQKSANGTPVLVGSVLLFGNVQRGSANVEQLAHFLDDSFECIFNGIRNETAQMLKEFQRAILELHSALAMLFRKELPEYLQNMEFGPKFIRENFAQVNVFLHKMNIEYWRQEPTYSIWSFFCDIGATMSLFLGASMLTIIEVLYFVLRQSRIYRSISVWGQRKNSLKMTAEGAEKQQKNGGTKDQQKASLSKDSRTTFLWV